MLFLLAAPILFLAQAVIASGPKNCTKAVTVPKNVKILGNGYISCPPPFGKAKSLNAIGASASSVNCIYSSKVTCQYHPKTGKKLSKSAKGCPATTSKATGCGSLCYTGCPAKLAGTNYSGATIFYEKSDPDRENTLMQCSYTDYELDLGFSCYYNMATGYLIPLEDSDPACPAKSAAKPSYCLLRK